MQDRLNSKFIKDPKTQCWNWKNDLNKDGYGRITVSGKRYYAHRFSWIVHNGEIPADLYVLHKCDNPRCVNPKHLFLGTQKDNMADKESKGRSNNIKNLKKITGSKNGASYITEAIVLEIRKLHSEGVNQKDLARQFGIGNATVWAIVHRHSWTHI